jgi:hypothetical protein
MGSGDRPSAAPRRPEPGSSVDIQPVASLPPLYAPTEARGLVERVRRAARGPRERRLFLAILRQAREDALEIEALYDALPGVLAGDGSAIESFRTVLDGALARDVSAPTGWWQLPGDGRLIPNPEGPWGAPCDPGFFLNPLSIHRVTLGIDRVAGSDPALYERYIDTLAGLWARTGWLDHLYRQSTAGKGQRRGAGLAASLRLIARDIERGHPSLIADDAARWVPGLPGQDPGRLPELPPSGPHGPPGGLPGPDDGPGSPWPGPDDGPPLPWPPPGGGPGLPPGIPPGRPPGGLPRGFPGGWPHVFPKDPCAFTRDWCRRAVMAGARALKPIGLPESTRADTITGLSPSWGCEGETITILGSNFGSTQPANVIVLIGALPAEVVSWSPTAIVIRIPAGATAGCIGFRNEQVETTRRSEYNHRQLQLGALVDSLGCLGVYGTWQEVPYVASTVPCTAFNYFQGTVPIIDGFEVDGATELVIAPGASFTLSWKVRNANGAHVRRTSADGPVLDVAEGTPAADIRGKPDAGTVHGRSARGRRVPADGVESLQRRIPDGADGDDPAAPAAPGQDPGPGSHPGNPALQPDQPGPEQHRAAGRAEGHSGPGLRRLGAD